MAGGLSYTDTSDSSVSSLKIIDFGCIPVDSAAEKAILFENNCDIQLTYRVSLMYVLDSIDKVFDVSITSNAVDPKNSAVLTLTFRPKNAEQSYTEYYVIDDTAGNNYRVTVVGKCFGPQVFLSKRKIIFRICKNVSEQRKETVKITNKSSIDTTYQWVSPHCGLGQFQISSGICGLVRAKETISATILFTGSALGIYTAELVCLILNQEPLFLNVIATVVLPGNSIYNTQDHIFEKNWKRIPRVAHFMSNSLNRLTYIPSASVFDRFLDFGTGNVIDVTLNISQTLCVTNHEQEAGYIQWLPDPDNNFVIDPIASEIPHNESRLFTVRFRPKVKDQVFGFLLCGDFQYKKYYDDDIFKFKHTWFRIPCIGNTWKPCTECPSEWDCPCEVVLPPTVPGRTSFQNFMLANKLDTLMFFKFMGPDKSNFVVLPMCGTVQGRGWQIIHVALEPGTPGNFYETWDIIINKTQKTRLSFKGCAEISDVEVMSHGYNPATHGMLEFPPTITGCVNYCTAFLHNKTRMEIHVRVLNSVEWLGADSGGSFIIPPKEIIRYHWWFFPKTPNKVYDTTITCSCICLIDGRPVGETTEIFIHIMGFSELPDLRVLPRCTNIHDVVVGENAELSITLYNFGSCLFTSKLYHLIDGMGDDFSNDKLEIDASVNSLKPSNHCEVKMIVTPEGAGSRRLDIKYTVLYRTETDEVEQIQPIRKTICKIWYDGIYPTFKVKRTISVKCPVILSNHCVWNIANIAELNKALEDCRPKKPIKVNLYAPDLCVKNGLVEFIFVLGCVYAVPVPWSLRREKICDCEMKEVQKGISTYEMRHTCVHRPLVELFPLEDIATPTEPSILYMRLNYKLEGQNTLCYVLSLPNEREIHLYIHILANVNSKGILTALRRPVYLEDHLAFLDCGRVPINNLDPVIRIVWLYNPTDVFTTWRLLRGNLVSPDSIIRCLLYFAEIPPLGKLAIPFSFMPTEMIDYEMTFLSSFGYEPVKMLVKGQGGLPNCVETRLDVPSYVEKIIRSACRTGVMYLSKDHITLPVMPTHSLTRDIISICNDTDHTLRFIWLPERIANIVNIVMTPCWGVIQAKSTEWITMTVYSLQEPSTFTTTVACEILDLTERKRYQRNELLRRSKIEKCNQEFIITEEGLFHPGINDSPPYVLDIDKPQPTYLVMSVSISTKGQRDGYPRLLLPQMLEHIPPYDLLSADYNEFGNKDKCNSAANNMTMADIIRIIDGILWDSLHSKMFKNQIKFYATEEIPSYSALVKVLESDVKPRLSRRVTSGICDAIVNKAVFHIYGLNPKHEMSILDA